MNREIYGKTKKNRNEDNAKKNPKINEAPIVLERCNRICWNRKQKGDNNYAY